MTDSSIHSSRVRALTIAGVDPSGGAGICADLKSFSAFGAYGMTVIAGLTAQNTQGVTGIGKINPDFLKQQLETLSNDIQIDTIKIGMLSTKENANIVKSWLKSLKNQENKETFVVLDPVMVATSGNRLLAEDAEKAVLELAEEADIITPNLPELKRMVEILQGQASDQLVAKIDSATLDNSNSEAALKLAKYLSEKLNVVVYMKAGHVEGLEAANDAIVDTRNANSKISWIATPWINTNNTHGTGCSLSSALAAVRPLVDSWEEAAKSVKSWMNKALSSGSALQVGTVGKGHGPIDHLIQIAPVNFLSTARRITSDIEDKITNTTFFEQLIDGDMELKRFANYLAQDNCYLSDYGSLLDKAANLAPNQSEKNFFKNLANIGTEDELRMHDEWHKSNGFSNLARNSKGEINLSLASKVTNGYINHLRLAAVKDDYEILISALLPCIFLYGEMVSGLKKKIDPEKLNNNIFKNWIELYADPENVKISLQMSEIVNKNAESVNQEKWTEMLKVYRKSAELEFEFFEQ